MTLPGPVKRSSGSLLTALLFDEDATPPAEWDRPTGLYRLFDADGQLLYVGITKRLRRRMTEHARDYADSWWPLVASRTVTWYQTGTEAGRAERTAITTENPPHNVMHTAKARVPLQDRPSRDYGQRGIPLLRLAQQHFDLQPFTAADAISAAKCSSATVQQWIKALSARGWLVKVGTRYCVSKHKGVRIIEHTLWAIPDSDAAHAGHPVNQCVDVSETTRPRGPSIPQQRTGGIHTVEAASYPIDLGEALMKAASRAFAGQPFTYAQVAEAAGLKLRTAAKHLRKLRSKGLVIPVGKAEHPPGRRGHPPVLYALAAVEVPGER